MSNQLNMADHQAILGLARLNWSQRRIAAELGIDRQTVSRHLKAPAIDPPETVSAANAAMVITGSAGPVADSNATIVITGSTGLATDGLSGVAAPLADSNATNVITGSAALATGGSAALAASAAPGRGSQCEPWRAVILEGLERGLTARRIWQDLAGEHGFAGDYQSVQRFVRRLRAGSGALPFRRMESDPGEEAQVDFGKAAPVVGPDGKRSRPHLFRIVLSCSRKAYSEAVPRQTTEQFLRCIENAFGHFGGTTRTLVVDNLKAAVLRGGLVRPGSIPRSLSSASTTARWCCRRVHTPAAQGEDRARRGYAQSNALKGRTFTSLAEQNRFLSEWEATFADTRIHGTTRQQVGKVFVEVEKPALLPLPPGRFPCFQEASGWSIATGTWKWPRRITRPRRSSWGVRSGHAGTGVSCVCSTSSSSRSPCTPST
jgi:transposase